MEGGVTMFLTDLLFVLIITMTLTALFTVGFRRHRTWPVLLGFFVILFMTTWAAGVWMTPIGSSLWGVPWLSFLIVGILFALLLTAIIPLSISTRDRDNTSLEGERTVGIEIFNLFFLILIIALAMTVFIHYVKR
jgi:hypothetical protein